MRCCEHVAHLVDDAVDALASTYGVNDFPAPPKTMRIGGRGHAQLFATMRMFGSPKILRPGGYVRLFAVMRRIELPNVRRLGSVEKVVKLLLRDDSELTAEMPADAGQCLYMFDL